MIFSEIFFEFIPIFNRKLGPLFFNMGTKYNLKKNQIKAMMIISKLKCVTSTKLCKCLDMKKGSLTTLIDSLEDRGYVKRFIDDADRRKHWICFTDAGEIFYEEFLASFKESFNKKIEHVPQEEISEYREAIKKSVELLRRI